MHKPVQRFGSMNSLRHDPAICFLALKNILSSMFFRTNCRLNVSVLCRIFMCVALRRSQEKWKIVHMLTVNQRGPSTDTWGSPDITHASSWAHRIKISWHALIFLLINPRPLFIAHKVPFTRQALENDEACYREG